MTSIPMPAEPTPSGALPSAQDLAAMGMTGQQFADLQSSIANMDLTKLAVNPFGTIDLIGGRSPYSIDESKYMVSAPLSNKGNPTSTLRQSSNDFFVYDQQPVRLVDNATGQVVFEGSGPEDARKASELAAQLTAQGGRKATWDIQTGPGLDLSGYGAGQQTGWQTVANEEKNKSTLGKIGSVVGTALPLAMIPLTMGASAPLAGLGTAGTIGLGAGVGAASAGLRGQDILKGAVMGGLTSAGGQLLSAPLKGAGLGVDAARAVGTGIGATAGGLATGQSLQNSLLGGVAAGGTTYLGSKLFGGVQPSPSDVSLNNPGDLAYGATGAANATNNLNAIAQSTAAQLASAGLPTTSFSVFSPTATPVGASSGVTGAPRLVVTAPSSGVAPSFAVTTPSKGPDIDITALRDLAVKEEGGLGAVGGPFTPAVPPSDYTVTAKTTDGGASAGPPIPPGSTRGPDIELTGTRVNEAGTPPPFDLLDLVQDPKVQEELKSGRDDDKSKFGVDDALLALSLLSGAGGGGGGGGGGGTPGTGAQALNPIFSAKLPTPGEGGAFKVGGLDYTTPPARSAADMYRYAMGPAMDIPAGVNLARATSPYAGFGPGTLGQETFNRITAGAGPEVYGRQPGFTGVTTNQTIGDTQVVDGNTWVWGGPQRGWEMQYIDPVTGQKKTIPGNGATNVSSFANNPTIPVNQPYFKQNLTNIPDWADTYHGWQKAMMNANVPQDVRFAAEREFMQALEQRPFSNANDLVAFARSLYNRSTQPRAAAHGGSMGYSRGSSRESFAVNGPGTGRSDEIPAVLSDGEYVIDAETVALLGDGSSKAGAKKLDEMRIKIRKHKGRNLAKGKFSVNAKRPEKYLSGGRA